MNEKSPQLLLSVVIPIYNEAEGLPDLFSRVREALDAIGCDWEVVLVNDGSVDASRTLIEEQHQVDDRFLLLNLSRNFGHQTAVSAGIHYARGHAIAIIDGDLQDPPELIAKMVDRWQAGADVVYAVRKNRKESLPLRIAYGLFYKVLKKMAAIDIPLDAGDFCLIDVAVADVLRAMPERSRFVRGLRSWAGFRQEAMAYDRPARAAGETKYTFRKLVGLALDGMVSFSSLPLKVASGVGMLLCSVTVLLVALVVSWRIANVEILGMNPADQLGWTSLVSLILLMSGLQLLTTGIVGEYLARVFDESKQRPPWIINAAGGFPETPDNAEGWFVRPHERQLAAKKLESD